MFAARGIAISFSVFVMVYCALSLAVCLSWQRIWQSIQQQPAHRIADFLFALRIFPLLLAAVVTAVFTVPSFLLLEPRSIDEPIGAIPLALGLCGAGLAIFGVVNATIAMRKASRAVSGWTNGARALKTEIPVPVLRISPALPAVAATGIVRSRVLLSGAAESVLTADELQAALSHEVAHVRRRDNLKKLLFRFVAFPGTCALETAWLEATEMAADDVAISSASEALDLAAALIKLSRLGAIEPPVDLTAALVHSPASIVNARVERLLAWNEQRLVTTQSHSAWYGLGAAMATVAVFAVTYSQLLVHVHTATEWLVR